MLQRGVRAPGGEPLKGLRERSIDPVEVGPFFISLHHKTALIARVVFQLDPAR
jgi:hypothetical protein